MLEVKNNQVYLTVDEKQLIDRLFGIKDCAAVYYKQNKKVAYHWNLAPETIAKLKLGSK